MEHMDSYNFCKPYLINGEYILWRGTPEKGHLLNGSDVFMIPFSLFWCGFAFFWEISVIRNGIIPFMIFGIPFVAMGLYIVFGRFIHLAWLRKRTYYVITNLKVIRIRNKKVDLLMGKGMPPVTVVPHRNGCGTIRIGQMNPYTRSSMYFPGMEKGVFTLENIPEVLRVQQLLTQIASQ